MIKVVFLTTSVVEAASGKTFEAGKAYWLRPDQYAFWDARGRIALAPDDMKTENAPFSVTRAGRNVFDVVGPSNRRLNTSALPWDAAEALRAKSETEWLAGKKKKPAAPDADPAPNSAMPLAPDPTPASPAEKAHGGKPPAGGVAVERKWTPPVERKT